MTGTRTAPSARSLFDAVPDECSIWFRVSRRDPWELIGTGSYAEVVSLIGAGGRRHGEWLVREGTAEPK